MTFVQRAVAIRLALRRPFTTCIKNTSTAITKLHVLFCTTIKLHFKNKFLSCWRQFDRIENQIAKTNEIAAAN